MCEKIIEKMPSMSAEERLQLRRNCSRAIDRSADKLVIQEAKRVLAELDALEQREISFIAGLPAARRIEYAFRRLPASEAERRAIRLLYQNEGDFIRLQTGCERDSEALSYNYFDEIIRRRRHLLASPLAEAQAMPFAETGCWANQLIDRDEDGRGVRLNSDATAAFASLGYLAEKDRC